MHDPLQYVDFAAWQHELSDSDENDASVARAFWDELGAASSPVVPFTRRAASALTEEIEIEIDDALARALGDRAGLYGTTPSAFAQAAWHAVLGRFSGDET